jgi:hypothetical protein
MNLEPLLRYFQGEKQGGVVCAAMGLVALALSVGVWRAGSELRTMALPLGIVALAQLGIGIGLTLRTPRQVAALTARFGAEPEAARAAEVTRMRRVNRAFAIIEIAEVAIIAASLLLILALRGRPAVQGVAMGLLLQASALLVFDLLAEKRAHAYTAWLDLATDADADDARLPPR